MLAYRSLCSFFLQALRLLLSSLSSIAGRYGRYIVPMISLSIDFYIRVFVRVYTNAIEVKKAFSFVLPSPTFSLDVHSLSIGPLSA